MKKKLVIIPFAVIIFLEWSCGAPLYLTARHPAEPYRVFNRDLNTVGRAVEQSIQATHGEIFKVDIKSGIIVAVYDTASWFSTEQIRNPRRFVKRLRNPDKEIYKYIQNQLSATTRKELGQWDPKQLPSKSLLYQIVYDLNELLYNESFYNSQRFVDVKLHRKTMNAVNDQQQKTSYLNRRLLQDIFRGDLWPVMNLDRPASETLLYVNIYLSFQKPKDRTIVRISCFVEGAPSLSDMDRTLFTNIQRYLEDDRNA